MVLKGTLAFMQLLKIRELVNGELVISFFDVTNKLKISFRINYFYPVGCSLHKMKMVSLKNRSASQNV